MALARRSKLVVSSLKELEADAFSKTNFQEPNTTLFIPTNLTLNSDTKDGVLGGSVAAVVGDYLLGQCTHEIAPAGLFVADAVPDNFVNAPAVASNKLPLALFGGEFEVDVFETNRYSDDADILAAYTPNTDVFCSPNGLLTNELPSDVDDNVGTPGAGVDIPVGRVTWQPVSTNLILGVDLLI